MKNRKKGKRNSVQELLGIQYFTDYGLMTDAGELVFFRVMPINISVLSSECIAQKIVELTNLLKLRPEIGIICTDSCACFDSNREHLRCRELEETSEKLRFLLEQDRQMLSRMQTEMSNAREFLFVARYVDRKPEMVFTQSNETLKWITEKGFEAERLGKPEIKRLLAIYFGTCMDGDKLPDVDGGQYQEGVNNNAV